MSQSKFGSYLRRLYQEKRELTILEITYAILAVVTFLIAAVIALLNQSLGVALLIIPFVSFLALSANIIVWALVKMFIEQIIKIDKVPEETTSAKSINTRGRKPKTKK